MAGRDAEPDPAAPFANYFEINDRFLKSVADKYHDDSELLKRVSLIDESHGRVVRMARLAVVVSHKVNGVSALHSKLMTESLFADFARIFPMRFTNVTNGVTARRWLALANPPLANVLDENIGQNWRTNLMQLADLKQYIDYPSVNDAVHRAKHKINSGWRTILPPSTGWWWILRPCLMYR